MNNCTLLLYTHTLLGCDIVFRVVYCLLFLCTSYHFLYQMTRLPTR